MSHLFDERPDRECLSRLELDRLLGDERTDLARARRHLDQCSHCRERFAELQHQRATMLSEAQVAHGVDRIMTAAAAHAVRGNESLWQRLLRPVVWAPAAASLAAACLLLIILRPVRPEDSIRVKGAASLQAYLVRGAAARPLGDPDRLSGGDILVFRVSSARSGVVLLAALDETGQPAVLRQGGNSTWPVQAGKPSELPLSVELDNGTGDERVFGFFCGRPPDEHALTQVLERAYPRVANGRRDLRPDRVSPAAGCTVRSVLIRRAGSPR